VGDEIEKNEVGGACSAYGRGDAYTEFWWGNLRERDVGWGGMNWIELAQDRDRWQALVNTVMNLWVS
jgi:hypothetical protein